MSCFEWEDYSCSKVYPSKNKSARLISWLSWDPTSLPLFVSLSCSILLWVYFFPSCVQFINHYLRLLSTCTLFPFCEKKTETTLCWCWGDPFHSLHGCLFIGAVMFGKTLVFLFLFLLLYVFCLVCIVIWCMDYWYLWYLGWM